jgi:hypothetical protein
MKYLKYVMLLFTQKYMELAHKVKPSWYFCNYKFNRNLFNAINVSNTNVLILAVNK